LVLRQWRTEDREAFAAMNADPVVMRHFPATLTREQSDALVDRIASGFAAHAYGLWAVEVPDVAPFAGFIGLMDVPFEAHFTPAVEVGWRLARAHWGKGYAPEGAAAALDYAFGPVGLPAVVSITTPANLPSRRVMEKLGMHRDPADDFDHPRVVEAALRRSVLYRLTADQWRRGRGLA
jgi:ribosomal-protein-alanine N-acetyltransferase